jgi:hypothetical protein
MPAQAGIQSGLLNMLLVLSPRCEEVYLIVWIPACTGMTGS